MDSVPLRTRPGGGRAPAGESILRSGGFEEWTGEACSGWSAIWPNSLKEAPRFERGAEGPHGGTACATLRLEEGAGYSSYAQRIEKPPAGAAFARCEGWIRAEKGTLASFLLIFFDPDDPKKETMVQTPAADGATSGITSGPHFRCRRGSESHIVFPGMSFSIRAPLPPPGNLGTDPRRQG